jgi:uroporphyrinogen-III synthase
MRLLVTRPEPDGARTAAALRERGHAAELVALLRIEADPAAALGPAPWGAVLITSPNAARAVASHRRRAELSGLPVFAVGRRSAEAARAAGFSDVVSADGDAQDLARLVAARAPAGRPLLYLAGEDRAGDLVGVLAARGLATHTAVVYRAVAETVFPAAIRAALLAGRIDGVLHYSRRSAEAFVAAARAAQMDINALKTKHYCLSAQVADALRQAGLAELAVAPRPDEPALFGLLDLA